MTDYRGRGLPAYTVGTISGSSGSAMITGASTAWISTDSNGLPFNQVGAGDTLVLPGGADEISIKAVLSATSLELERPLPAAISGGTAYRIVRRAPNPTGYFNRALQQLEDRMDGVYSDDGNKLVARTVSGIPTLSLKAPVTGSFTDYISLRAGGDVSVPVRFGVGGAPAGALHAVLASSFSWGGAWGAGAAVFGGAGGTSGGFGISYNNTDGAILGSVHPGVAWKDIVAAFSNFIFKVNNSAEAMRITSGGLVGIGVSAPAAPLAVKADSAAFAVDLVGRAADNISIMRFRNAGNSVTLGSVAHFGTDMLIVNGAAGAQVFHTNNVERMRITSSGNVGIGTSSPGSRFEVVSSGYGAVHVTDSASGRTGYIGAGGTDVYIGVTGVSGLRLQTNATDRITMDSAGNIAVFGTMFVSGPIRCGSYTVATVPSASTVGEGTSIYVSNESGGAVMAFSDGTNWRRVTDRAVIS